jgi:hypothetical protein
MHTSPQSVADVEGIRQAEYVSIQLGQDRCLAIERDTRRFYVDGREGFFRSTISRDIVLEVIRHSPKSTSLEDLTSRLGDRQFAKYVSYARDDFKKTGLLAEVIVSVRGTGYQLTKGWSVDDPAAQVLVEALHQIQAVVDASIAYVAKCGMTENKMCIKHIERNITTVTLGRQHAVMLNDAGWLLLHELCRLELPVELAPDVLQLKLLLDLLKTYAEFSRAGHMLTDEQWRNDFERELICHHRRLVREVERLRQAAAQARQQAAR